MIRRIVVYTDSKTGKTYKTPEFNGDKSEYAELGKCPDGCDADWSDIFKEFENVNSLDDFKEASKRAQGYYHSFLGTEVIPVEEYTCVGINIIRDSTDKSIELYY